MVRKKRIDPSFCSNKENENKSEVPGSLLKILAQYTKKNLKDKERRRRKTIKLCRRVDEVQTEKLEESNSFKSGYLQANEFTKSKEFSNLKSVISEI